MPASPSSRLWIDVRASQSMPSLVLVALGDQDETDPELDEIETYALTRAEAQALYDALGSWLNS